MKYARTLRSAAKVFALGCSISLLVYLAGCVSTPRGAAAREWSLTLREMQIVPVFPPREDVYVGDVYVVDQNELMLFEEDYGDNKEGFLPISILAAHVPLEGPTSAFYNARPSFPPTDIANADPSNATQPVADHDVYTKGDVSRLRIVGFPEFMSATITQADISAFIPTEAVNIGAAAGFTQSQQVKISVPVAESYVYPAAQAFAAAQTALRNIGIDQITGIDQSKVPDGGVIGHLRLITEVYYTRVIDVSFFNSRSRGVKVDAKINAPPGLSNPEAPPPPPPAPETPTEGPAPTPPADGTPPDAASTANTLLTDLNNQLDAAMASQVPGGKVRFVSAGAYGVAMRRTFERPVAIGYRGLLIEVRKSKKDGIIFVGKGALTGWSPTDNPNHTPGGGDDAPVTPPR